MSPPPTARLSSTCTILQYYHISNNPHAHSLQQATDTALSWSNKSHMNIDPTKINEMLESFSKVAPHVPALDIDNQAIEHTTDCPLVGVVINEKLI